MCVWLDGDILNPKLRTPRPSHDGLRDLDPWLILQRDSPRQRFCWSQRYIAREFPSVHREISHGTGALGMSRAVRDGEVYGEPAVGPDDEGHDAPRREAYSRRVANYGAKARPTVGRCETKGKGYRERLFALFPHPSRQSPQTATKKEEGILPPPACARENVRHSISDNKCCRAASTCSVPTSA